MKTWQVWLLAIALVVAAFVNGGLYTIVPVPRGDSEGNAYKINRFTGRTWHYEGSGYRETGEFLGR